MFYELYFIITPRKVQPILVKDPCEKLNIIKGVNLIQNLDKNNVLATYKELFTQNLNKAILHEHFKLPTCEEVMVRMARAKIFSKLDSSKGFLHVQLDEESSRLYTFITPEGRYRYQRLLFGVSSAPEIYHRTICNKFEGMKIVETFMDNIVIWETDTKSHLQMVKKEFNICKCNNLTLNREKCQIAITELTFLGDQLTANCLKPDLVKVKPVVEFTTPKEQADVAKFLCTVRYTENLSQWTLHMRSLQKANIVFTRGAEHKKEFNELKKLLLSQPLIQFYNLQLLIKISCDTSKKGLGAILEQQQENQRLPVAYVSRAITKTQSRYALIEREALAIQFSCDCFHQCNWKRPTNH